MFYETLFLMRSGAREILPLPVRRSLEKLGSDLRDARRRRRLTVGMMLERVGISKATYLKLERGDPGVAMGAYAMALFVLGFSKALSEIADSRRDDTGLLLDTERLPERVRPKKRDRAP